MQLVLFSIFKSHQLRTNICEDNAYFSKLPEALSPWIKESHFVAENNFDCSHRRCCPNYISNLRVLCRGTIILGLFVSSHVNFDDHNQVYLCYCHSKEPWRFQGNIVTHFTLLCTDSSAPNRFIIDIPQKIVICRLRAVIHDVIIFR